MKPATVQPSTAMGVRALTTFAEVIRTSSATEAARNLGMTQPAVSRIIAQMERTIGFDLFYRDRGRLVATKDGLVLANEVNLALAGLKRVDSLARDIATSSVGELRVVAPPSFTEGLLPEIVASFFAAFPEVRLNLDTRSPETAKAMIANRVVDCGFLKLPIVDPDLKCQPLINSGSCCVLSADHPLAGRAELSPRDLHNQPLILLGAGRTWRAQVDQAFAEYGLAPTVAVETHTHGTACALAARGVGVAIVNKVLAESYLRDSLVAIPFIPAIEHRYAFVTSARSYPSRAAAAFYQHSLRVLNKRHHAKH